MNKILVIGCPGSGKSTFAKRLHQQTHFPIYHLDQIWHRPDKTNISETAFDQQLSDLFKTSQWIIDGNYNRTLEMRLKACDTVFFLDLPVDVCIQSVESRIGKKRDDMPWIEEEFDEEFRQFILDFPAQSRPYIEQLLNKYKSKINIFIFKSREEVNHYLLNQSLS